MSDLPQPELWGEIQAPRWEPSRTAWLLTCVDLTSLLVGFFVLLFSTQTLERDKWKEITGSFQAQFAPTAPVVAVVPDGGDNAVVRVTGMKSGLAYLDTLLRQRLQGDAAWGGLSPVAESGIGGRDMRYVLTGEVPSDAWVRLAAVVGKWKNPVGLQVTANRENMALEAQKAIADAGKLSDSGVMGVFVNFVAVDGTAEPVTELVVRAQ